MSTMLNWPRLNRFQIRVVIRNKVYVINPPDRVQINEYISEVFTEYVVDRDLCRVVCESVLDKLEVSCNFEGGHFENLRNYTNRM